MNIILYDDHILFGESLKRLITENDQSIKRFDYVSSEDRFFQMLRRFTYVVALLDINLKSSQGITGFDLIQKIKKESPPTAVIMLSSYDMPLYKAKAFEKGAVDYLNKSSTPECLIKRIHDAVTKETKEHERKHEGCLTHKEIEVLREVCKGKTKKEVAKVLFMSERTLYNHLQSIYDKLSAENTLDAYNKAIKLGYIDPLV